MKLKSTIVRTASLPDDREVHLMEITERFPKPFYVAVANLKVTRNRRYNAGRGEYFDDRARADRFFDGLVAAHAGAARMAREKTNG